MDKLILTGNLTRDPEMRYTPQGKGITNFTVAVNSTRGDKKTVKYFRVSAWEKLGEICNQYLKKGSKVLVEATINADEATGGPRIWTKADGTSQATFEVTATSVEFLSPRAEATNQPVVNMEAMDEVPF